jgi:hypothetical protein
VPSQRNTEISSVFFGAELGLEDQVELAALAKQLEEVYPPGARTGPQGAAGQGAGGRQRRPLGPAGGADGAVVAARTGGAGHRPGRGPLDLFDRPVDRGGLSRPGDALEGLVAVSPCSVLLRARQWLRAGGRRA